jgi:hypothetical protein
LAEIVIGRSSTRFVILVQIGNPTWLPGPIMCSDWLKIWKSSCQTTQPMELLHYRNDDCCPLPSLLFLCWSHIQDGHHRATIVFHSKTFFLRNYLTKWIFLHWFYTWSIILVQIGNPTWLIDAKHYDFSVNVTNFGPKLRCYGQQSTCYGFPIIAGPEPFPI